MKSLLCIPFLALGLAAILPSCATNSGDPAKDARARAVNQTLTEAGTVLGKVAVASLFSVAQQEAQGGKADWQQAAVAGLYANLDLASTAGAVRRVVDAYAGGQAPQTAVAAGNVFATATTNNASTSPAQINSAIAAVVSAATGAPATR